MNNYFENDELAEQVWKDKYRLGDETLNDFFDRIASEFARLDNFANCVELQDITKLSSYGQSRLKDDRKKEFLNLFKDFKYIIPGGSVLAGIGSGKPVSLSNCFVIENGDSISEIFNAGRDMAQIYKRRGGVGQDLSMIRPAKAVVNNAARTTGGVVPFMELYSQTTNTIGQDGRRGALMLSLDINHPDSPQFITSKQDLSKITGANISVRLNYEFMKAVENNEDYILRWPCTCKLDDVTEDQLKYLLYNKLEPAKYKNEIGVIRNIYVKKVKAKELWESIIQCAWNTAEPGILFWDNILNNDPASVYPEFKAVSTNPCQPGWATILTPDGIKTFNDITIGSIIWSKDGWTKVVNKVSTGVKEVYEYRTTRNVFYGTENHKLVDNGIKIEAKDAKNIDSLQLGNFNTAYFEDLNNQDIMDGLVIGDGFVHKASNNLVLLCIGENDTDYFNSEIKDLIIKHREALKKTAYEITTTISYDELLLLPIREIPNRFFHGNILKVCGFLRGLYSANGSIVDKRITFKTSSSKLRDQIQIMLSSIGINSYFTTNKKKKVEFSNGEYECKESYDINISTDRVKFQKLIGFLQEYKNYKLNIICQTKNSGRKEVNPIKSVKLISTEEVFDITVDNNSHTYWTGGCNVSNCGEIPLSPYDSCRLIATNLYSLVNNPFTRRATINPTWAYKVFYEAQIIGDILVDLEAEYVQKIIDITNGDEKELWKKIKDIGLKGRRTGVGVTGYADMCAALGTDYGDEELTEYIMKLKMEAELNATTDLAIINGSFPSYNKELEYQLDGDIESAGNHFYHFLRTNFREQYEKMKQYGRRNVSWSTIAPTGTISMLAATSSGCEPVFSLYYKRRKKCNPGETPDFVDLNGVGYTEHNVVHGSFKDWYYSHDPVESLDNLSMETLDIYYEQSPWYKNTANDIEPYKRVQTQAIMQRYTTHSISSTINLPSETTQETIDLIYRHAWEQGLKGVTVYRDGCRSGILVNHKEEPKIINERPVELECKVEQFKNEKKDWIAIIGLLNGYPHEIFTGPKDIDVFPIPSAVKEGYIIKVKIEGEKSRYDFRYIDSYGYTNTLGGLSRVFDKELWNYGRLISGYLRSHMPIEQVIKIVNGLEFTNKGLNNWKSGVTRALKPFIPDGIKVEGAKCENCGGTHIVYEGGCSICKDCGSGKCG